MPGLLRVILKNNHQFSVVTKNRYFCPNIYESIKHRMRLASAAFLVGALFSQTTSFFSFSQPFYHLETIQTIELFFAFPDWNGLLNNANQSDTYVLADSVRINGIVFDSVGVKYKGSSSYNPRNAKNPFHIQLNYVHHGANYEGYTNIKLNNNYADPSMIREVLAYALLDHYMDSPKANFANVYVNGVLRGLYSNVEAIDNHFNNSRYHSDDGTFVKCTPSKTLGYKVKSRADLMHISGDSAAYYDYYELKSEKGWRDLIDFIDTLNHHVDALEKVLDVDRALWMLAFNNALVNLDSYTGIFRQNYYLYKNKNKRFVPTIWDLNMCFGGFSDEYVKFHQLAKIDPFLNDTSSKHPLIRQLFTNSLYKRMYMAHFRTIMEEAIASSAYHTLAERLRATIDASVKADRYSFYTYEQYQKNLTNCVTQGGRVTTGVQGLMNARNNYLMTLPGYMAAPPQILSHKISNMHPICGETISITATCHDAVMVRLNYRTEYEGVFRSMELFDDGKHADGEANDEVYGALIQLKSPVFEYYIYAENRQAGAFSPVRAEHEFYALTVSVPQVKRGDLLINELMAENNSAVHDSYGEFDDWIELYNPTNHPIDLSSLFLTDESGRLKKWRFPANTGIASHGFLIVWADNTPGQGGLHACFKLKSTGETLLLSDGVTLLDSVCFPAQRKDTSYMRCPVAKGGFQQGTPSFNAPNNCAITLGLRH